MADKLTAQERDILYNRFLEACDVLRRLPPVRFPKEFGNSMPDVIRDYADANMREEGREKGEWSWGRVRLEPAPAAAISRMEEVTEWSIRFLMDWPRHRPCSPRECLWASAICAVGRRSFAGLCRKRGWARATAYMRVDQALMMVRDGLFKNNIELKESGVDYIGQFGHK